jgi:hypothetical protein
VYGVIYFGSNFMDEKLYSSVLSDRGSWPLSEEISIQLYKSRVFKELVGRYIFWGRGLY